MPCKRILKWTEFSLMASGASQSPLTGRLSILYYAWAYLSQANFLFFCVSLGAGVREAAADKDQLDRNEEFLLLCLLLLWKLTISYGSRMRNIIEEVQQVEARISSGDPEIRRIYDRNSSYNYKVFFFLVFIYFTTSTVCISNAIEKWRWMRNGSATDKSLVIVGWFPKDYKEYFDLAYFYQICNISLTSLYATAFDSLFISLVNSATVRISILKYKLTYLNEDSTARGQTIHDCVGDIVMEHKNVIRYVENLNESLKWFLLGDFLSRSYHVSLTIMSIIRHRYEGPIFFDFLTMIYLVSQISFFYYHANRMILESTNLSMNIFHSEWYDQSSGVKRSLLIVMARSQRPLVLTIGNFRIIDNNLIVQIVKAGYTFFLCQLLDILHK